LVSIIFEDRAGICYCFKEISVFLGSAYFTYGVFNDFKWRMRLWDINIFSLNIKFLACSYALLSSFTAKYCSSKIVTNVYILHTVVIRILISSGLPRDRALVFWNPSSCVSIYFWDRLLIKCRKIWKLCIHRKYTIIF
jgi:hypothetical protein